jgi:hypothetical protein
MGRASSGRQVAAISLSASTASWDLEDAPARTPATSDVSSDLGRSAKQSCFSSRTEQSFHTSVGPQNCERNCDSTPGTLACGAPASSAPASALVIERQAADVSRGFLVSQGTERRCSRIFCHHGLRWTGHQTLQEAQDDCARGRRLSSTFDKELKLKTASKKIIHHSLLRCATSHQTSRPRSGRAVRICYGASVSAGGIGSVQQNLLSLVPAESAP